MRASVLCLLLGASAAVAAPEEGRGPPPGAPLGPDFFVVFSPGPGEARAVPLRDRRLPDLSAGEPLEVERSGWTPVRTRVLSDGSVLVVQAGRFARFAREAPGSPFRTVTSGAWPAGWWDVGSSDLDQDGAIDLLLVRKERRGVARYHYRVARGSPAGDWDFGAPARPLTARGRWWLQLTMADVDGDGRLDLVFHSQPHNRACPLELEFLRGRGDGSFVGLEAVERALTSGLPGSSVIPADFDRDGRLDLLLAPDDDVPDDGQAHLAWGLPRGAALRFAAPAPHVDFDPEVEGPRHDVGRYVAQACDVDLDGWLDLVVYYRSWRTGDYRVAVRRGLDEGRRFGPREVLLEGRCGAEAQPTLSWPTLDGGDAGGGIWSEGHW